MKTRTIVIYVGLLVCLFFIVRHQIINSKHKGYVKSHYSITTGRIVKYKSVGIYESIYLTYLYQIDNRIYYREINTDVDFPICINIDNEECKRKLFWVIYSPEHPQKSLINLSVEIQNISNPIFPKSLEHFE